MKVTHTHAHTEPSFFIFFLQTFLAKRREFLHRISGGLFGLRLHMVAAGNRVFRGLHTIVPRGEKSYFSEAMNVEGNRVWGGIYPSARRTFFAFPPRHLLRAVYTSSIGFYPFRVTRGTTHSFWALATSAAVLEFQPA